MSIGHDIYLYGIYNQLEKNGSYQVKLIVVNFED